MKLGARRLFLTEVLSRFLARRDLNRYLFVEVAGDPRQNIEISRVARGLRAVVAQGRWHDFKGAQLASGAGKRLEAMGFSGGGNKGNYRRYGIPDDPDLLAPMVDDIMQLAFGLDEAYEPGITTNDREVETALQPEVSAAKERIRDILSSWLGPVGIDARGEFSVQVGSARVFVSVRPLANPILVDIYAITNEVPTASPELYRHIALHSDDFILGHLGLEESPDGKAKIRLRHTFVGTDLTADQIKTAIGAIATSADRIDDEIKAEFGGSRYHEA